MPTKSCLHTKALEAIDTFNMLDGVSTVIAAVSGGADSISLLHFLWSSKRTLGINVRAAHVNHNLRGEESRRDELFVRELCSELGIPLDVLNVDVGALAKERGIGTEECGRSVRYEFFGQLCSRFDCCAAATAHTASDNAETILLNMTRGCGLDGLCGIPPKREGVIRPLIGCLRSDVEDYCALQGLRYVTDSTNLHDDYSRNRLRLNVAPELRTINPSFETAFNRMAEIARSACGVIGELADEKRQAALVLDNTLSRTAVLGCSNALMGYVVRRQLDESFGLNAEKKHLDLILDIIKNGSGAVEVRKNKRVRVKNGLIMFESFSGGDNNFEKNMFEIPLEAGISFEYNGKHYDVSDKINVNCEENRKINKKLLIDRISCGIISVDTKIRTRRSGDTFTQFGRGCTKTVKKLFSELKLEREDRETRLLAANGSEVLWIEGIGTSESAAAVSGEFIEIKGRVQQK